MALMSGGDHLSLSRPRCAPVHVAGRPLFPTSRQLCLAQGIKAWLPAPVAARRAPAGVPQNAATARRPCVPMQCCPTPIFSCILGPRTTKLGKKWTTIWRHGPGGGWHFCGRQAPPPAPAPAARHGGPASSATPANGGAVSPSIFFFAMTLMVSAFIISMAVSPA